ncbi:hypothetical protein [Thiogranum longum]
MSFRNTRYRKPDLLVLITFFVGFGVLVTSFAQAAEPALSESAYQPAVNQSSSKKGLFSFRRADLAKQIRKWKPKFKAAMAGDGLHLSRPFGTQGPALKLSSSVPSDVERSLLAGGDHRIGTLSSDYPDAYLFLQKRW